MILFRAAIFIFLFLILATPNAFAKSCTLALQGDPEAFITSVLSGRQSLTFEEAVAFAAKNISDTEDRESFRALVEDELAGTTVKNTPWFARFRVPGAKPANLWRSQPVIRWIMRPIRTREAFLREIQSAMQVAALLRVREVYDSSVYTVGPGTQLNGLVGQALEILTWKGDLAASPLFMGQWRFQGRDYLQDGIRILVHAVVGIALPQDLGALSVFRIDKETWPLLKSGNEEALRKLLLRREGWRAYLGWYGKHIKNVVRAALAVVAVMIGPEVIQTAWHQYNLERAGANIGVHDPNLQATLKSAEESADSLEKETSVQSQIVHDSRQSSPAEKEIAQQMLNALMQLDESHR